MSRIKGSVKTGGRKAGTVNKITSSVRGVLSKIVEDELNHLPLMLAALTPAERVNAVAKMLPYVTPRMESIDATACLNELLSNIDNLTASQLQELKAILVQITYKEYD